MTDTDPYVAHLSIYPIKSLDGVPVETVEILQSGALQGDREFALFDDADRVVNGKRHQRIHAIRAQYDLATHLLTVQAAGCSSRAFHLTHQSAEIASWFSQYFGFPITLKQNLAGGFPDDTDSPGPTIISTATLEAVSHWYPDLTVDTLRLRLRTNIEIAGVPAFWEDRLFAEADTFVPFQIDAVQFRGINPCQRCVVVTRDPNTGEPYPNFQKQFAAQRQASLPPWTVRHRFNHFYRLAVNTQLPPTESGKTISLGDRLTLL